MKTINRCPWCIGGIDNCHCSQEEIDQYYEEQEDRHVEILSNALMEEITDNQKKAAIVDKLMAIVPFRNINTHTIDNLVEHIEWFIQDHARLYRLEEKLNDVIDMVKEGNK